MLHAKLGTWIRTIAFGIALLNQILVSLGKHPIPVDEVALENFIIQVDIVIATVATTVTGAIAWWRNNSFSSAAVEADDYLEEVRKLDKAQG